MRPTLCLLHLLLLIAVAISGCVPASLTPMPTQMVTHFPSPTVILPTSTPIPAPTATTALTPPATLEPEQAKETIQILLSEPVDCSAPCFWGITPRQTTLGEAENVFTNLGLSLEYTNILDGKEFYESSYDFESDLSVSPLLTVHDNTVVNLTIYITPETHQAGIPREWLAYSPETLISQYGLPSKVEFAMEWGPRTFFDMVMYFETVEMIVEYTGYEIIAGTRTSPYVCPLTDQFVSVRVWLGQSPFQPPAEAIPLEDATDMTMEEFSKLMTGDPNRACFNAKGDIFP